MTEQLLAYDDSGDWILGINDSGHYELLVRDSVAKTNAVVQGPAATAMIWEHLAVTYDPSAGDVAFYINGAVGEYGYGLSRGIVSG